MSYAGPASRGNRAPNFEPTAPSHTQSQEVSRRLLAPGRPAANQKRDRAVVFAAGIAVGVAVGAGIALLMAPRSGADTRRAIAKRGRRLSHRGHDAWDDLRDELREATHNRLSWNRNGDSEREEQDEACED